MQVTRQSLAALRAARELAAGRLRERQVIAPQAGVVRNLRIRPGQLLAPGDMVLTLVDEERAGYSVVALVPGQFRPMIAQGMPLRFELEGYPQVARTLSVEEVGDEVVGPQRGAALPGARSWATPWRCRARWCWCAPACPSAPSTSKASLPLL